MTMSWVNPRTVFWATFLTPPIYHFNLEATRAWTGAMGRFRDRMLPRQGAHPVRGKDRSPPFEPISQHELTFLPIDADARHNVRKEVRMPHKRLPAHPNLRHLK